MFSPKYRVMLMAGVVLLLAACASTGKPAGDVLREAGKPAWSLRGDNDEFQVFVSPAGRTLKLIPRVGRPLGMAVDFVVNESHSQAIHEALGEYDPGKVLRERCENRLQTALGKDWIRVAPLISTAGYSNTREAQTARLAQFARKGIDDVLDLNVKYGLFGEGFEMKLFLEGVVREAPGGRRIYRGTIPVTVGALRANHKHASIIKDQIPFSKKVRFSVEKDAESTITANHGELLRHEFETAADSAISALLCDLGLAKESAGEYVLGRRQFAAKHFDRAKRHFENALELDPESLDAANDLAVTLAFLKRYDEALQGARRLVEKNPDYGPAQFNLAWWLAFHGNNLAEAAPHYQRALDLGQPGSKKLERALKAQSGKK